MNERADITAVLTEVWREASRHIEIQEAVTRLAPVLEEAFGFDVVIVRRLNTAHSRLETVGVVGPELGDMRRTDLSAERMDRLVRWCESGEAERGSAWVLRETLPTKGSYVVGPLTTDAGPMGLLLVGSTRAPIQDAQVQSTQALLEPFAVALDNDLRFHEIARLREAVEADNRALLSRLDRQEISDAIVGEGSGLREVMARVEQVAPTDASVLILGETGSGKEVVARAIHARSKRASGPIVRINCGAIPPELIDSELFGHERGSFTGAVTTRKGWFERADGGTLFLDEIGELPLAAQVRLLRILQDGSLERVGGQRAITVDVRIVAATHRNLEAMVADGRFREDLWYRISVFPVRLPALRERPEDIPALATHFAKRAGMRLGWAPLVPTDEDIALLRSYSWPGNVRELASVIERAAILGEGRRLQVRGALGAATNNPPSSPPPPFVRDLDPKTPVGMTLDSVVTAHIERVLRLTQGRIEGPHGAARILDINPHTLRARMRKLGIHWSRFREGTGSYPISAQNHES